MLLLKRPVALNRSWQPIVWGFIYLVIASAGLFNYIDWWSPVFLLGIICLVQVSMPGRSNVTSWRFAYVTFAFSALSIFLPFRTILYLTASSSLLFILEANYGKVRYAAVCTLIIMSPIFEYASTVFSFPIRLQLTSWASHMMAFTGQKVVSAGNMLTIHGNEFTVDPECMGLNMMETSLLLGIMISSFYQEKFKVRLRLLTLVVILALITALNIISNLFRIIAIVQFNIMPGTAMHDVIGIACLLMYVFIPGAALIKIILKNSGKPQPGQKSIPARSSTPTHVTGVCLLVGVAIVLGVFNTNKHEIEKHSLSASALFLNGFTVERIDADILKLKNDLSLVYIKSIPGFYSTEHNPMICWKGSGYAFQKVEKIHIERTDVYTAILIKGDEKLYTAWWYDNAKNRTISQLGWRWDAFKGGSKYSLINITCSNNNDLYRNIVEIFKTGQLNKLLKD